jgi:hypothetical protein
MMLAVACGSRHTDILASAVVFEQDVIANVFKGAAAGAFLVFAPFGAGQVKVNADAKVCSSSWSRHVCFVTKNKKK